MTLNKTNRLITGITLIALFSTTNFFSSTNTLQANDTTAEKPAKKTAEQQAEDFFKAGRKALFQGKYDLAIKNLEQAVRLDKSGTKANYRLHLARAFRYAKQLKKSEKQLVEILKKSPDHVEAGQFLAEIYQTGKRWKEIVSVLKPLLRFRHDYTTYHLLAEATFHLNQRQDSRKYYKKAIQLNPKSGPDHYQLGNIHLAENHFALAAISYENSMRFGLDSPILNYKLGSAYFNLRNYFGRIMVVKVASGKVGAISGDWYLIETVPGKKQTFRAAPKQSAIYQIANAMKSEMKKRTDIQILFANIYLNARRYKQAYEMFEKLEKSVPKDEHALFYYNFSRSAFGVGKLDSYLTSLKKSATIDSKSYHSALVDAYVNVANKYNQLGNLEKYIHYLSEAVQASPETSSLHLKLANAYEETREYEKAVQQWQMVLDLEPDHPQRTELLNRIKKRQ